MAPEPTASVSPGTLLEMQILRSYPGITASEPLRLGPAIWVLRSLPSDANLLQFENLSSKEWQHQHATEYRYGLKFFKPNYLGSYRIL